MPRGRRNPQALSAAPLTDDELDVLAAALDDYATGQRYGAGLAAKGAERDAKHERARVATALLARVEASE